MKISKRSEAPRKATLIWSRGPCGPFQAPTRSKIGTFKAYIERQAAANRDFCEKLLRAKDFQDALAFRSNFSVPVEGAAAEEATQIGAKMAGSFKQTG